MYMLFLSEINHAKLNMNEVWVALMDNAVHEYDYKTTTVLGNFFVYKSCSSVVKL